MDQDAIILSANASGFTHPAYRTCRVNWNLRLRPDTNFTGVWHAAIFLAGFGAMNRLLTVLRQNCIAGHESSTLAMREQDAGHGIARLGPEQLFAPPPRAQMRSFLFVHRTQASPL